MKVNCFDRISGYLMRTTFVNNPFTLKTTSTMKLIWCIVFAAACNQAQAQDEEKEGRPKLIGYLAGLGISDLPGLAHHSPNFSFSMGIAAQFPLSARWSLGPELNISLRGTDRTDRLVNAVPLQNERTSLFASYVDIPLLLRYRISRTGFVGVGAQLSFLINADQTTIGDAIAGQRVIVTETIRSLMHKESFMIPLEVGLAPWKTGSLHSTIKLRYNIGIMEAFTTSLVESKFNSFQLVVTLNRVIRKKA